MDDGQNSQPPIIPKTENSNPNGVKTDAIRHEEHNPHNSHLRGSVASTGQPAGASEVQLDETETRSMDNRDSLGGYSDALPVDNGQSGTDGDGARLADGSGGLGKGEVGEAEHSVEPILSTQSQAKPIAFNKSTHKRSRIKKGWLIKRLTGYSIAETEYGVSYLWVLSRKPDRTSADNSVYGLAGYFNWESLNNQDLLRKEKKAK